MCMFNQSEKLNLKYSISQHAYYSGSEVPKIASNGQWRPSKARTKGPKGTFKGSKIGNRARVHQLPAIVSNLRVCILGSFIPHCPVRRRCTRSEDIIFPEDPTVHIGAQHAL